MGRTSGTPNKITAEVRDKLENLIDSLVDSIEIDDLNTSQRIKMLQIALQYTWPRLQATLIKEEHEDQPLFIEDIPINWKDASGERETITTYIKKN
jgi:Mg2+/Co2+ transporter CorB